MKKIKQFWDKFTDDQELIRLKLGIVFVLLIIGLWIDGR